MHNAASRRGSLNFRCVLR